MVISLKMQVLCKLTKHQTIISLLSITMLGFFLRFYRLGAPSLWYDEIRTAGRIEGSFIHTIKALFVSPFPPGYYMIMNIWTKFFGNSEFSLRFPSLIFSVLSIIFIYKLAKELFNTRVGLISALLLSVSPYSINYAQEAKMYAMVWCLGALSFIFFIRFIKDHGYRSLLAYVLTSAAAIYTLYVGFIFIVMHNVLFFVLVRNLKRWERWLLGQAIIILLYLPWINIFWHNASHRTGIEWLKPTPDYFILAWDTLLSVTGISIGDAQLKWLGVIVYGFLVVPAVSYFRNIRRDGFGVDFTKNDFIIWVWILLPIIGYFVVDRWVAPVFSIRYVGFMHIPLIILFSKGLNKYAPAIKSTILIFLLFIIATQQLYPYYAYNLKVSGEDWRSVFQQLEKRARSDDYVVFLMGKAFTKCCYYDKKYNKNKYILRQCGNVEACGHLMQGVKDDLDGKHAVFVVYRQMVKLENIAVPKKYQLIEHYRPTRGDIGFLWFKPL